MELVRNLYKNPTFLPGCFITPEVDNFIKNFLEKIETEKLVKEIIFEVLEKAIQDITHSSVFERVGHFLLQQIQGLSSSSEPILIVRHTESVDDFEEIS